MYGFCYPSEVEQTRLYHGKNDHRSKESGERLWHMCMCALQRIKCWAKANKKTEECAFAHSSVFYPIKAMP